MVVTVIFSVLFLTAVSLYITGSAKKIIPMEKTAFISSVPFLSGIAVPLIYSKLPDSMLSLFISSIAISITFLLVIIKSFKALKIRFLEKILFLSAIGTWIFLFYSIFYLYQVHTISQIVLLVLVLALLIFTLLKLKIKSFTQIVKCFLLIAAPSILLFISLFTLVYAKNLYSILCFLGSLMLTGFAEYYIFREKSEKPLPSLWENLLLLAGTGLLYAGTVLMHFK